MFHFYLVIYIFLLHFRRFLSTYLQLIPCGIDIRLNCSDYIKYWILFHHFNCYHYSFTKPPRNDWDIQTFF